MTVTLPLYNTFLAMHQRGDDLEDDFVIDDLVALSDNETVPDGDFFSDEGDASGEDGEKDECSLTQPTVDPPSAEKKKRKRREKEKERKAKVISSLCLQRRDLPMLCSHRNLNWLKRPIPCSQLL